jgi:alpha-beta hydrolase superfamily lysophospholipase
MDGTGLAPQLRSIECADGYVLHYRTWLPAGPPSATFVLLNGLMSHSGWFQPLADHVGAAGVKLVGADRRGTGMNESARGDAPSAGIMLDDVKRIIDAERCDGRPVHLGGWCWGAVLAVNVAAACEHGLASLVLLAPGLYPSEAVAAAIKRNEASARSSATAHLEVPIPDEMFTRGPYLALISDDVLRCRHVSIRFYDIMRRLAMGAAHRLGQLALPILLVLARADEATDNVRTRRELDRLTRSKVALEILDGAHGLQFEAPAQLAQTLVAWSQGMTSKAGAVGAG